MIMPTTRQRYQVTETDALAHALELAELEWPNEPRSRLIERLATTGAEQLEARRRAHAAAVDRAAGMFTGMFPPNALAELRKDWPE